MACLLKNHGIANIFAEVDTVKLSTQAIVTLLQ